MHIIIVHVCGLRNNCIIPVQCTLVYIKNLSKCVYRFPQMYEEPDSTADSNKLSMQNVGGVFVVLISGCIIAFFVSILEFLWNVRKVAVHEKVVILFSDVSVFQVHQEVYNSVQIVQKS